MVTTNICRAELAPYACHDEHSRGRYVEEAPSTHRNAFQRDRDRIIHSAAFRRLKYKTQVFVYHEGDNYRTRLTHTLEVAQISRSIARTLNLHEDLAEAVALAHDLGHPPFAHCGEDVLVECMKPYGGFEHNDQSLRIVTYLEKKYADFDGLNLTWETLEGIAKHNGPIKTRNLPPTLKDVKMRFNLRPRTYPSAEAQIAALADDIAYNNHDVEDGIRAGFFTLDDLKELPLFDEAMADVRSHYSDLEVDRERHEVIRRVMGRMIGDVLETSREYLMDLWPQSADDIRNAKGSVIMFSPAMDEANLAIKAFLRKNMYRHYQVNRMWHKVSLVVKELFDIFFDNPRCLPHEWQTEVIQCSGALNARTKAGKEARARVVLDYVAGMTDRYALLEHKRLFDAHE